eukprot:1162057-Pelagomonas_calceolata.AAC.2
MCNIPARGHQGKLRHIYRVHQSFEAPASAAFRRQSSPATGDAPVTVLLGHWQFTWGPTAPPHLSLGTHSSLLTFSCPGGASSGMQQGGWGGGTWRSALGAYAYTSRGGGTWRSAPGAYAYTSRGGKKRKDYTSQVRLRASRKGP